MIEVDRATFILMGVLSIAFCLMCLGAALSHVHDQMMKAAKPKPTLPPLPAIEPDPVDHPPHYNQGEIECIDAIRAALGEDGFRSFCKGNALKYIWRADHKQDATEDIRKAIWYLNRSIGGEA